MSIMVGMLVAHDRFDVDTPEGLAKAIEWQQDFLTRVEDQARWHVPRSHTILVLDKVNKNVIRLEGRGDERCIRKVFAAMGWTWEDRL